MLSNATNQPKSTVELGYMCPRGHSVSFRLNYFIDLLLDPNRWMGSLKHIKLVGRLY